MRLSGELSDAVVEQARAGLFEALSQMDIIKLTRAIFVRTADAFPLTIGTLDGMHLSSALIWKEKNEQEVVFLTHDRQLARVARAMDLQVEGDESLPR